MLVIKTYVSQSPINGTGVFADEFVREGDVVWVFQSGFDTTYSDEQFKHLPTIAQEYVTHYGYYSKAEGGYILCADNARFTNHSLHPTIVSDSTRAIATRDIQRGEEITENYYNFDEQAELKLK